MSANQKIGLPVFTEDYVLQTLLRESDKFNAFYQSERHKIGIKINWVLDEQSSSQMKSVGLENPDTKEIEYVMIVKEVPIRLGHAFDTAHALQHLVLSQEGFPSLCYFNHAKHTNVDIVLGMNDLACRLSDAIIDPLVNARLAKYDFDLSVNYEQVAKAQMPFMQSIKNIFPNEPAQMEGRAYIAATFIQAVLDWEVACPVSPPPNNDYVEKLRGMFPETTGEAEDILALIKKHGYDTPDKAAIMMLNILQKYRLRHLFTLSRMGSCVNAQ